MCGNIRRHDAAKSESWQIELVESSRVHTMRPNIRFGFGGLLSQIQDI